jgi:hypothetical protein
MGSEDINTWFEARLVLSGLPSNATIGYDTGFHRRFSAGIPGHAFQFGDSLEEAITACKAQLPTPAQKAAELRAKAQAMLVEADAICPK